MRKVRTGVGGLGSALALGAAWCGGAAQAQVLMFTGRNGQNTAYCGLPGSGPLVQHSFATATGTHDPVSVSDPGGPTWSASNAGAILDAAISPTGITISVSGSVSRGPLLANGVTATADTRDNWEFDLAAPACFSYRLTFSAASPQGTVAGQGYLFSGGQIIADPGTPPDAFSGGLSAPGMIVRTAHGTLMPGHYTLSILGRAEGGGFPYSGSYASSMSLGIGAPAVVTGPAAATACATGSATFAVEAPGATGYQWQLETAPGVWASLGNDPMPLLCGGSARTPTPTEPLAEISIVPCAGRYEYRVRCLVSSGCGSSASDAAGYTVCFANCDCSSTSPALNVLDFSCFLNQIAAGNPLANCDGSTTSPVLNILDFSCFLNKFAAGCQ